MKLRKIGKALLTLCTAFVLLVNGVTAQEAQTFTDADIASFVKANKTTMPIQMEAQKKMLAIIKEQGMDMGKFQTMSIAAQQGDKTLAGATEDDKTQFKAITDKVAVLQGELGTKLQTELKKLNVDPMKFQMMAMKYNQDAEFRSKVDKKMAE